MGSGCSSLSPSGLTVRQTKRKRVPMSAVEDLKPGDHLCHLYKTEEEHRAILTPFLRRGLERGEKVLVILDERPVEAILDYLRADGLDPRPYLDRGQLVFLTSDETYLRDGTFDPDRMIASLKEETDRALAEGYTALRVTGEMTWALRGLPGCERLVEYEVKLRKFFPGSRCLAICQYDQRRFPPDLLLDVLHVHSIVALGTEVYDNLYYRTAQSATTELEQRVENLRRGERSRDRAARYAARMETIHALGQSLVLTHDRQRICQVVVEAARQALGFEVCGIWLVDARGRRLVRAAYAAQDSPVGLKELPLEAERGIVPVVARSGQAIYLPDVREDPRYIDAGLNSRSEFCVPLAVRGRVLGVLNAESRKRDGFNEEDRRLFTILADYAALALANAEMFQVMEAHARELEALNDLGRALSGRLRVDEVAEEAYRQASRLLDTTNFYVALYDEQRDEVIFVLDVVEGKVNKPFEVRRKGEGLTEHIIRTREPLLIPEDVPRRLKELGVEPIGPMARSWLGVPLIFQDRVIGVIGVQSYTTPRAYTEHERDLLTAIAAQVAVALENARLFERMQRLAKRLALVSEVAREIATVRDLDTLLRETTERIVQTFGYDYVAVFLSDPDTCELVFTTGAGIFAGRTPEGFRQRLQEGMIGWAAYLGKTLLANDVSQEPRYIAPYITETRAELDVPLKHQDQVIGVLDIQSRRSHAFDAADVQAMEALAGHIATAIENARLHEELRAYAEELEQKVEERTAELRAERERIQAILDSIGEGVVVTDLKGRVEYMNPAAERITGYTTEEMRGQRCNRWLAEEADLDWLSVIAPALRAGEEWISEAVFQRKDGTRYDAQLVVTPIRDPDGRPIAFVGILEDISHLRELDHLKSQFIADAAHELRTPVTTIKLYVDLLRRGPLSEKQAEHLRMLAQEADLLAELVEDLLDLSRLERGVARFEPEPLDLNEVVGEVVTRHAKRAAAKGVSLSYKPQPDLPSVTADRSQIQRAVSNLVTNAINYTPAGGQVVVRTAAGREQVRVIVADTGYGISEEERERIFDRFFRGSAAKKSGEVGSGLGLPIACEIVGLHGGGIEVESEVGEGSTFTLWLPITPGSEVARTPPGSRSPDGAGGYKGCGAGPGRQ